MITTLTTPHTTFQVDDVTPTAKVFTQAPLADILVCGMGAQVPIWGGADWTKPVRSPYRVVGLKAHTDQVLKTTTYNDRPHPLLEAVHLAFANHLPLTLSPDMVWQTILQGVSQHISLLPEEHRKLFVTFEGQQALTIIREDLSLTDLTQIGASIESIAKQFVDQLGTKVTPAYVKAFDASFSTTTPIETTVARIACMEAFSPFFTYQMICGCGFPAITLTGTPIDWRILKSKVIQIEELFDLGEINLTWWTGKLRTVLDHFISAAEGQPHIAWWKRMYKQIDAYLSMSFNGWIGWLWPYIKTQERFDGKQWVKPSSAWERNPMLEDISDRVTILSGGSWFDPSTYKEVKDLVLDDTNQRYLSLNMSQSWKGSCFLGTNRFPMGLSQVNLKLVDGLLSQILDTVLIGGFLGVSQNPDSGLTPQLGYALLTTSK